MLINIAVVFCNAMTVINYVGIVRTVEKYVLTGRMFDHVVGLVGASENLGMPICWQRGGFSC